MAIDVSWQRHLSVMFIPVVTSSTAPLHSRYSAILLYLRSRKRLEESKGAVVRAPDAQHARKPAIDRRAVPEENASQPRHFHALSLHSRRLRTGIECVPEMPPQHDGILMVCPAGQIHGSEGVLERLKGGVEGEEARFSPVDDSGQDTALFVDEQV